MASRLLLMLVLSLSTIFTMGGCEASPWEKSFVATHEATVEKPDPKASVQVREVPWDRLQASLFELKEQAAASDIHPDDWTPEQKAEVKAKLLRALQVTENPQNIMVLGRSSFRTTDPPRALKGGEPDGLAEYARKIGATNVAWTHRHVGQAEVIVQEPVSTFSVGVHGYRRGYGGYGGSATTWVPVPIMADQYAFVAYYMRPAR